MTKSYWHTTKFGYPNDSKHNAPAEIAVLDVDGDGDVDVFVSEGYQPFPLPMHVLINDGKGHFADKTKSVLGSIPTGMHPREIVVDDFNNDGRPDLFVADHGYDHDPWPGAQNKLFLSSGAHGFVDATSSLPPASDFSHSAASADIDGDKDIDIYVGDYGGNPINPFLLINDGSGSFTRSSDRLPIQVATQEAGFTTEVFLDADGDGDADLFLGGAASSSRIYLNPGNGDFSSATLIDVPQGPFPVANMIAL
ncbi:MAG: VCBS repeat-containing protein, partial [Bauldia sp.]|uniref:FG-GAP repeat domain-containing protein n=1 Tax=Bauldia sp. TaxID=2575872 RepID=UPI001D9B1767